MSEGTRMGDRILGLVEERREGWFLVSPGFSGCSPGKVSGLQADLDSSNSSSACPFLLVDS